MTAAAEAAGAAAPKMKQEAGQVREQTGTWQQLMYDALHANVPPSCFAHLGRLAMPFLCPDIHVQGKQQRVCLHHTNKGCFQHSTDFCMQVYV
jgi:hypothetical protein